MQALISETIGMGAGAVHRNSSVGLIVSGALLLMLMLNTGCVAGQRPASLVTALSAAALVWQHV